MQTLVLVLQALSLAAFAAAVAYAIKHRRDFEPRRQYVFFVFFGAGIVIGTLVDWLRLGDQGRPDSWLVFKTFLDASMIGAGIWFYWRSRSAARGR